MRESCRKTEKGAESHRWENTKLKQRRRVRWGEREYGGCDFCSEKDKSAVVVFLNVKGAQWFLILLEEDWQF